MDASSLIDPLNEAQREAVTLPPGSALVLAGAGSGKTRVLVHRIAWLLQAEGVPPHGILAVTFTNKAAGEMRQRIEDLLGYAPGGMWVGTFHGLAHRLLRLHWQDAGLRQDFQVMDAEDQLRVVKRVVQALDLDEAKWPPKSLQWWINARKDEGQRPQHIDPGHNPKDKLRLRVYEAYQAACERAGLVDFAELLLRAHELWLNNPALLEHYRLRFGEVLVDEFQDTNTIQYAWVRLLAGDTGRVFVVGDDDQSIYGWRGARIENIHRFAGDFPGARVLRLTQNYRSSGNILALANGLIRHNADRLGKELWTEDAEGEPITLYHAFNDVDEARFVVQQAQQWVSEGGRLGECAILYRSNAQSRLFEESLLVAGVPYRVYGGLRFFERAEIKDALAYLRLVANRSDDASFERVVNTPARGIGAKTLEAVRGEARALGVPLWRAAEAVVREGLLAARASRALAGFLELVGSLDRESAGLALHERVEAVIDRAGLLSDYRKEGTERAESRQENLRELIVAARQYETEAGAALDAGGGSQGPGLLAEFLAHAALEAGEAQTVDADNAVQLMTLHAAKGLEFPLVFLVGMEDGLFPSARSVDDPKRLEEERRLCYVGITRARQRLFLSHAEHRRLYGGGTLTEPSRFLRELPGELIQDAGMGGTVVRAAPVEMCSAPAAAKHREGRGSRAAAGRSVLAGEPVGGGIVVGQRVAHARFGEGVVLNYEGSGSNARVEVNFEAVGTKWLVVGKAPLQAL